jgi:hypothetical protein
MALHRPKNIAYMEAWKDLRTILSGGFYKIFKPYVLYIVKLIKAQIKDDDSYDPFDFITLPAMTQLVTKVPFLAFPLKIL